MNAVLVGVGVLPHRTPVTPRDLLAVHLHWKGSRDCRMLRLAHMRMQSRQADRSLVYMERRSNRYFVIVIIIIIINAGLTHLRFARADFTGLCRH